MNRINLRTALFLVALCCLAVLVGVFGVRSVHHAAMLYLVGAAVLVVVLDPFAGFIAYLVFYYVKPQVQN